MKKIAFALLFLGTFLQAQTNTLLNGDFWKSNPDLAAVKAEIGKGNNPSESNRGNHDVPSIAINNNADFEVIQYLIDQPGNAIDKNTHDGRQYIHWAANKGNLELIDYLIRKGSDLNRTDDKGATPLVFAASNGQVNIDVYRKFFDAGIDPKQKYAEGANLLLFAIAHDTNLQIANYLTTKGLSIKDVDAHGRTAFDYAARNGNLDLLKTLVAKGVKPTHHALLFAAQGTRAKSNPIEVYQYLIETMKLDPKAKGLNGESALHYLVKKPNQLAIIDYLVSKGADINAVKQDGNTVLMEAASSKNLDVVQSLIAKSAEVNAQNKKGANALTFAVQSGTPEIVSYLIAKGAKTNATTKDGNLAFALIQSYKPANPAEISADFLQKLELLKQAGVDFSVKVHDGSTLLHAAVAKNDLQLLKVLAPFKLAVNAQDENGLTPLHKAAMMSQDDTILQYLLSIGAEKNIQTEFGETAYDLASENEFLKDQNVSVEFLKS
ncbi:ankyrin repeat domain-containing protein [Vaginella massiliensis]|uniref:ankyrin repeat domain-containing protein n=1 Tax=Vaginella massiliensis TaxID=1816680 RepID=UPI000839AC88|nr:ankyrin repeat domain-containing protein [Vaginella massiliensis]